MTSSTPSTQSAIGVPSYAISVKKERLHQAADTDTFPEGGTRAWCTVIGALLVQMCGWGYGMGFGVYQDFYTLNYLSNESSSAVSWIGSTNTFLLSVFSVVSGILYDRGYFYHLMVGGSLLESFSLFALSFAQPGQYYQIFLSHGISLGIAQGLLYIPSIAVISHYFQRRCTLAMSLVVCGSSIGSMVHPIMLNYLFNRDVGFSNGVRVSAGFISALLLAACFLLRTRLDPPQNRVNYLLVGRRIVHDISFCIMCIAQLLFQCGFYYPFFYLQLDSSQHQNSETFSFYSLVLLNFGCMLGQLSAGFVGPSIGITWMTIIATAACGIIILGMIGLSGIPSVVILGLFYGYFSGIYIAMIAPLTALLTINLSELGARMGIAIMIMGIGNLLSGPIAGASLTSQYKWWQASLFSGLIALVGCSLFVVMELVMTRRRHRCPEKQEG